MTTLRISVIDDWGCEWLFSPGSLRPGYIVTRWVWARVNKGSRIGC